jgi:hypothetical protein
VIADEDRAYSRATARWAGSPLAVNHWLESESGFPPGSVGATGTDQPPAVVSTSRGVRLTRHQVTDVLAFTEFLAGRALAETDRAELEADLVDAFDDSPKQAVRFLHGLAGGVRRVGALHPIERAQRRLQALTATYTTEQRRLADGADPSPIVAVLSGYNPLVRYWASTGVVLVADALSARVDQHRLVLHLVGREPEQPPALAQRLLDRLAYGSPLEVAELAASELRLLSTRTWLRDLGDAALERLRRELADAVPSALDVDIVVQHVAYRAAMAQA